MICHIPPGNPDNAHTITVGAPAVAAHMTNHGDAMGPCETTTTSTEAPTTTTTDDHDADDHDVDHVDHATRGRSAHGHGVLPAHR